MEKQFAEYRPLNAQPKIPNYPFVAYLIRNRYNEWGGVAIDENDATVDIINDLWNLFGKDHETLPLDYTDKNTKYGWADVWWEKIVINQAGE
jgi:hypothetical protein